MLVLTSGRGMQRLGGSGGGGCSAMPGWGLAGASRGTGTGCSGSWRGGRRQVKLLRGLCPATRPPPPPALTQPQPHLGQGSSRELQLLLEEVAQRLVLALEVEDPFLQLDALLAQVLAGAGGGHQPGPPQPPTAPPPSPSDTHLLVEQCLHHVVGDLRSRGGGGLGGVRGHTQPRTRAHACAHVSHVLSPSPVPHPGSARTSPAGSRWPGPGPSSPPGDRAGTAQGTWWGAQGTKGTPPLPGGTQGRIRRDRAALGAVAHKGHGRQESAAPPSWHLGCWLRGTGHGYLKAPTPRWQWPRLHGGSGHGCPVAPITAAQRQWPRMPWWP